MNSKAGVVLKNPTEMIGKNIWEEFPEFVGHPALNYEKVMKERVFIQTEEYYDPTINGLKIICFHLKMELPSFVDITDRKKWNLK
jgi:hypothetical protein